MKASTKRRRNVVRDKNSERAARYFAGKFHPQRRRPLHALRGRALRRRVEWMRRAVWRDEGFFDALDAFECEACNGCGEHDVLDSFGGVHQIACGDCRGVGVRPVAFRRVRQAARARRFACAGRAG